CKPAASKRAATSSRKPSRCLPPVTALRSPRSLSFTTLPCFWDCAPRVRQKKMMAFRSRFSRSASRSSMVASRVHGDGRGVEEPCCFVGNAAMRVGKVMGVDLVADTVATPEGGGECGGSCPKKRVEHGVPGEGEHADQAGGQLERVRRRVVPG